MARIVSLNRRRYWLIAVLALAVLTIGNWWLNRAFQPEPPAPVAIEQRIDYALTNFQAQFYDTDGKQTLRVAGPRLEHDALTREATIEAPRFAIDPADAAWSGRAETGRVDRDSNRLVLDGSVRIERPHPRGQIRIESDELHYDRPAGTIHSPGPARIEQAGTELTGGTLTVWIDDQTMELERDVHALYRGHGNGAGGAAAGDQSGRRAAGR